MKTRIISFIFALMMVIGMIPSTVVNAASITTDVVIHKRSVDTGTTTTTHDGTELPEADAPGAPLSGIVFKYWTVSSSASDAQMSAIAALATIEQIEAWAAANPTILTGGTETTATGSDGTVTVTGLAEGIYLFGEVNGSASNVTEYIGVPFLLELPAMKTDGTGYFGTGADALHVYPKNATHSPGLDLEKTSTDGTVIGGAVFEIQKYNGTSYVKDTTLGVNGSITLAGGKLTLSGIPAGQYQLVETKAPAGYILNDTPVKFTVSSGSITFDSENSPLAGFDTTGDNPKITIKNEAKPTIDKTVDDAATSSATVGDNVAWTISTSVPKSIASYNKFIITDTIDSRLDFKGTAAADGFEIVATDGTTLTAGTHYTVAYNNNQLTVTFIPSSLTAFEGQKLTISYNTVINETAGMGEAIPNDAELNFDNGYGCVTDKDDQDDPPIKPPVTPEVWTGGAKFAKVDGSDNTVVLPGAEFKIATKADGTTFLKWTQDLIDINTDTSKFGSQTVGEDIIMKSGTDGTFEIKGLKAGDYWLVETKAPSFNNKQYNLLRDPAIFTVTETSYDTTNTMKVENNSGIQIPKTGGIGTLVFTILGVMLMGAAVMMYRRERQK